MRSFILAVIAIFSFSGAMAAEKAVPATTKKQDPKASQTQHDFEDLLVQGKYHFSDEAVTTVEDDKALDSLIGVRSDFKDRIKQSSGLY